MRCSRCQTENRDNRRYCRACGLVLRVLCISCGFDNLPTDHFCGGCGLALSMSPERAAFELEEEDPTLDPVGSAFSPEPNRLVALRAELAPAPLPKEPGEDTQELELTDLTELDDQFIQGEL